MEWGTGLYTPGNFYAGMDYYAQATFESDDSIVSTFN